MNKIKQLILILAVAVGVGMWAAPAVGAITANEEACRINPNSLICRDAGGSAESIIGDVVNTLLFILGAIAVVMIIVGGIMYAVSAGDASGVTKAKNTILYAVIGLVVAFLAYAIVNWVLQAFTRP